jgi:hypothetical protein
VFAGRGTLSRQTGRRRLRQPSGSSPVPTNHRCSPSPANGSRRLRAGWSGSSRPAHHADGHRLTAFATNTATASSPTSSYGTPAPGKRTGSAAVKDTGPFQPAAVHLHRTTSGAPSFALACARSLPGSERVRVASATTSGAVANSQLCARTAVGAASRSSIGRRGSP